PRSTNGPPSSQELPGWKWLGSSSCASAGCHHGNGPKGNKGSEYSTWAAYDTHARTYTALFSPEAKAIGCRLQIPKPSEDFRCLGCHTANAPASARGPKLTRADAVNCESCHGPAEKWVDEHYSGSWRNKPSEEKERLGMRSLKDLLVRARLCAGC